uniref:Uncharacterized protein n=1 Tax=Anguilla anguilla TaxID=7936 RepID=A0A0E9U7S7_ANGAN
MDSVTPNLSPLFIQHIYWDYCR